MMATRSLRSRPRIWRRWRLQVADVVADAAHAELAEVGEVLANLGGVEMELLGQRLRRNRPHAVLFELVQTAEIDRQPVGRELGNLVEPSVWASASGRGLVRGFHKPSRIVAKTAGRG